MAGLSHDHCPPVTDREVELFANGRLTVLANKAEREIPGRVWNPTSEARPHAPTLFRQTVVLFIRHPAVQSPDDAAIALSDEKAIAQG